MDVVEDNYLSGTAECLQNTQSVTRAPRLRHSASVGSYYLRKHSETCLLGHVPGRNEILSIATFPNEFAPTVASSTSWIGSIEATCSCARYLEMNSVVDFSRKLAPNETQPMALITCGLERCIRRHHPFRA